MSRPYLLAFDQEIDRATLTDLVQGWDATEAWVIFSDNAAVIVSADSARDMSADIREKLPGKWFILTEIVRGNCDGWVPTEVWGLINNPEGWMSTEISPPGPKED